MEGAQSALNELKNGRREKWEIEDATHQPMDIEFELNWNNDSLGFGQVELMKFGKSLL